jgi:glutamate dehydrogenase/leucine dehydrogenase
MGAAVVRYFTEAGGILRAVSDPVVGGTFLFENGASAALIAAISSHEWPQIHELLASEGVKAGIDEVLYQPVDLLFPAAIQNVVTAENAHRIAAKRLIEAANNPCSSEARTALYNRGVLLLPDFIANPGGIVAAFVEMSSSISVEENLRTKKNTEDAKLLTRERISANVRAVLEISKSTRVEPVVAGRYLALKNMGLQRIE